MKSCGEALARAYASADAFLFADDAQIREVHYREEIGELGYRLQFWLL